MSNLMPMEFKKQRIMTTKLLAEQYGTDEKILSNNLNRNLERFIEGKHYFKLQGEELKEFKGYLLNDESLKFVSVLILWTEKGALRHAKILETDEAWEVYEQLEETYFRVKEDKPTCIEDVLIQSLQQMKDMKNQLNQVNQNALIASKKAEETQEEVQAIREVIEIRPSTSWRGETNRLMTKVCFKAKDYQKPKDEVYKSVNERARVDLKRRLENMRARFILNGGAKSKAEQLNYLDVIAEDAKLIEIYTAIVKEVTIKYGV